MNYSQQQLIELFGEGCEGIFSCPSLLLFSDRCSQLMKIVREVQVVVRCLCQPHFTLKERITRINQIDEYQEIFQHLLAYTGLTQNEALESECKIIGNALDALSNDLDELFKEVGYECANFDKVGDEDLSGLKEYTKISESLSKTVDIKIFEEKMQDLVQKSSNEGFGPAVFICSSSGTGKTNMALSLNSPFLYFQYYAKPYQPIDRCFTEQSSQFTKLITRDIARYFKTPNMDESFTKNRIPWSINRSLTVETLRRSAVKFKSVGFLVELIKMLKISYDASPPGTNPAELQASIRKIGYRAMTVNEGSLALKGFFNGESYFFPLIFDRCFKQMEDLPSNRTDGYEDENAHKFIFLRSIARCLLCMPIYVGANPMAANFLRVSSTMESFGAEDSSVSCLVWHRPLLVLKSILTDKFSKIRDLINEWRQRKHSTFPSDRLLNYLEKWLSVERPSFLASTESFVEYFCNHESSFCDDDEEFLALLTEDILDRFNLPDDSHCYINKGQPAYMSAYTWDFGMMDAQNAAGSVPKEFSESDLCIQDHFCDLAAAPDDPQFPKYTTVATTVEGEYRRVYRENLEREFYVSTRYEPFNIAPLTGLIVTGVNADNQRILCRKMRKDEHVDRDARKRKNVEFTRISLMARVLEYKPNIPDMSSCPITIYDYSCRTPGFRMKFAFLTSSILASRGGGLKGCPFSSFLEHLAREYDINGKYGDGVKPPSIRFHEDFPTSIKEKQIPFLASMALSKWNKTFAKEVKELFGAYLGTLNLSKKKENRDVVVVDYPTNSTVFVSVMQHVASLDVDFVKEHIITKFKKYPTCNLFLGVALSCANLNSFYERGAFLWVLERTKDGLHLVPAKTKIPQKMRAVKHIIILDMNFLSHSTQKLVGFNEW